MKQQSSLTVSACRYVGRSRRSSCFILIIFFFHLTQMMCFSLSGKKRKRKKPFSLFHALALISSIFCHGLPCSPDQTITKRLLHQVEQRRSRLEIRCAVQSASLCDSIFFLFFLKPRPDNSVCVVPQSGPGDTVQICSILSGFLVFVCCDSPLTSFSFLNQRRSAAGLLP